MKINLFFTEGRHIKNKKRFVNSNEYPALSSALAHTM